MPSANELMAGFNARHSTKKKRTNWRLELRLERERVINEAITRLREKIRSERLPESFNRGHYAAITVLEIMRDEK